MYLFIGKFTDKTFHVVERARAPALLKIY